MIVPEDITPLTYINLTLAGLLVLGALADLVLYALLRVKNANGEGGLRVVAVFLLTLVGLLSVIGSVTPNDVDAVLRPTLGVIRGAALLLVWTLVVYDLSRYMNERIGAKAK